MEKCGCLYRQFYLRNIFYVLRAGACAGGIQYSKNFDQGVLPAGLYLDLCDAGLCFSLYLPYLSLSLRSHYPPTTTLPSAHLSDTQILLDFFSIGSRDTKPKERKEEKKEGKRKGLQHVGRMEHHRV